VDCKRYVLALLTRVVLLCGLLTMGVESFSQASKQHQIKPLDAQLLNACRMDAWAQVKTLLAKGANVNVKGERRMTPLMIASIKGKLDIVKLLIAKGADVNAANFTGLTALHLAAGAGSNACVEYLLQKGAKRDASDSHGTTPMGLAQQMGIRIRHGF
jgi:ankyrin repeat protein